MARFLLINNDATNLKQMEEALGITPDSKKAAASAAPHVATAVAPTALGATAPAAGATPGTAESENKLGHETDHEILVELDEKKVEEALNTRAFDVLLIDHHFIKGNPPVWAQLFRKKITFPANQNTKFVVLSYDESVETIRRFMLKGGFDDYIVLPVDAPIFREKISLLVSKKGGYKKEIYSMPVTEPVRVAYNFEIEDIGEFGLTLKSNKKYEIGEFISFFSAAFAREGGQEVIGKCYQCDKHPSSPDLFQSKFVFLGNGPAFKKQVRTWMKTEYIRKKQAA